MSRRPVVQSWRWNLWLIGRLRLDTGGNPLSHGPCWKATERSESGFLPGHPGVLVLFYGELIGAGLQNVIGYGVGSTDLLDTPGVFGCFS